MWPFLIGLVAGVIKTFATSAASSAGSKVGELIVGSGSPNAQQVVTGLQPSANPQQQLTAQQEFLRMLKDDTNFQQQVREILEQHDPQALAAGHQVEAQLQAAPEATQEIVSGQRPIGDALNDPAWTWTIAHYKPSNDQLRFLRSATGPFANNKTCPVGGEDLGFLPEATGGVNYVDGALRKVDPLRFYATFARDPRNPANWVQVGPESVEAVCRNGHRWKVFAV